MRQWDPDWVQYDDYHRPVICNPYHDELRLAYTYQGAPRVIVVPPLASIALEVAEIGAYNFTALVSDAVGTAINVAVGSFYGGGYYTGPGLPPPPPPPPPVYYYNTPVVVSYSQATYQPFVVSQIVDAGVDPSEGEQKVLLDGVTPAWGAWTQTDTGQRQFVVHKTQQLPGIDAPQEGPLPGNYQLQLASSATPAGFSTEDVYLVAGATAVGTLILAGGGFYLFRRRPRRRH